MCPETWLPARMYVNEFREHEWPHSHSLCLFCNLADMFQGKLTCAPFHDARTEEIQEGIDYLNGLGGSKIFAKGGKDCTRVNYSCGSGIWLCNDVKILTSSYLISCLESDSNNSRMRDKLTSLPGLWGQMRRRL